MNGNKKPAASTKPVPDASKSNKKVQLDYSVKENRSIIYTPPERIELEMVSPPQSYWNRFSSYFSNLLHHPLTGEELAPFLEDCRKQLIDRNVAVSVADDIVDAVNGLMVGKEVSSMSSIQNMVREVFREVLTNILTPTKEINLLYDIERKKPYVIVFCGVNGVGKSTNLAKIAAWLVQNKKRVMLAACDTFRSGAIEQLRVHATKLNIPLFSRGYEKEPAMVAQKAIEEARKMNMDVLLIDTAGRMQDNAPLMKALMLLITFNQPDLILFVGEALVGNDGIDQLGKFNDAIKEGTKDLRSVDGIVLSKFDTVDEKMGAAVSMVRLSGKPIVFVGTGQTYADLKRLNVDTVVNALLS